MKHYYQNNNACLPGGSRAAWMNTDPASHALAYIQMNIIGWDDYTYRRWLARAGWTP